MKCPTCSAELQTSGCPVCDTANGDQKTTISQPPPSDATGGREKFAPGSKVGERFRIVARLGAGGMGEVYRADDLKLSQQVALKFIAPSMAGSAARISRLHAEVRLARQVTHPNVCRVYDIGEVDGQHFISMELVDGEDLAHLLRRIGRLPEKKAAEIAQQVASGLAAAHGNGVVHRDLKPSNIMIDGRGNARITDFGLAVSSHEGGHSPGEGTPAYMAPEQLHGAEVTFRSDLYSLGLLMYELFTGRAAFPHGSALNVLRMRSEPIKTPSEVAADIDPAIEKIILHCLEEEPRKRPASAAIVAAAVAGDDPLARAVAAGLTPSPEEVAEGPSGERLGFVAASVCLLAVITCFVAMAAMAPRLRLSSMFAMEPPSVLETKSKEVITRLGHRVSDHHAAIGYLPDELFIEKSTEIRNDRGFERFRGSQFVPMAFWYRTSPRPLAPQSDTTLTPNDPPFDFSHMQIVAVDPSGRLRYYREVPPQSESPSPFPAVDWTVPFELAGFPMQSMHEVKPKWTPPDFSDETRAWDGLIDGRQIHIEASAYKGRVHYFEVLFPWDVPLREQLRDPLIEEPAVMGTMVGIVLVGFSVALLLAYRNVKLGRGDRKGALRLAAVVFWLTAASWLLRGTHVLHGYELDLIIRFAGLALVGGAVAWILYVALEPYLRRRWPHSLISWTRALRGQIRDPLVARDVLAGFSAAALILIVEILVSRLGAFWSSGITFGDLPSLLGPGHLLGALAVDLEGAIFLSLAFYVILYILLLIGRTPFIATALFVTPWLIVSATLLMASWRNFPFVVFGLTMTILLALAQRFGVLAVVSAFTFRAAIKSIPFTLDVSSWHLPMTLLGSALVLFVAAYAFWTTADARRFVRRLLLET